LLSFKWVIDRLKNNMDIYSKSISESILHRKWLKLRNLFSIMMIVIPKGWAIK
jgi:hypothetical protein